MNQTTEYESLSDLITYYEKSLKYTGSLLPDTSYDIDH